MTAAKHQYANKLSNYFPVVSVLSALLLAVASSVNPVFALVGSGAVFLMIFILVNFDAAFLLLIALLPLQHLERYVGGVFGLSPVDPVAWGLVLVYLLWVLQRPGRLKFHISLFLPLGLLLAAMTLSLLRVGLYPSGLVKVISYAIGGLVAIVTFDRLTRSSKMVQQVVTVFLLAGVFFSMIGIAQYFRGDLFDLGRIFHTYQPVSQLTRRVTGLAADPNSFAIYLAVPFLLSLALVRLSKGIRRVGMVLLSLLFLATILLTLSRSVFLAIGLALIAFNPKRKVRFLIVCTVVVVLLFFAYDLLTLAPETKGLLFRAMRGETLDYSAQSRIYLARTSWDMFLSSPVLGIGPGQYLNRFDEFRDPRVKPSLGVRIAHNTYLAILAETGIVGFVVFLWFLARVFRRGTAYLSTRSDIHATTVASGVVAGFIATCIYGTVHTMIHGPGFWVLAGMVLAVSQAGVDSSRA